MKLTFTIVANKIGMSSDAAFQWETYNWMESKFQESELGESSSIIALYVLMPTLMNQLMT